MMFHHHMLMERCKRVCNPNVPRSKIKRDEKGKVVDSTHFRQMIGRLMYMLATRRVLTFSSCPLLDTGKYQLRVT